MHQGQSVAFNLDNNLDHLKTSGTITQQIQCGREQELSEGFDKDYLEPILLTKATYVAINSVVSEPLVLSGK